MQKTISYDLRVLLIELVDMESDLLEIYLFGSRAHGTGSMRSDCDLLVRIDPTANAKASRLLKFAADRCPALDFFLCSEARAVSVTNDSFVFAASFASLVDRLGARVLWSRLSGFAAEAFLSPTGWIFEVSEEVTFVPTVLPNSALTDQYWRHKMARTEAAGLPITPYLGDTVVKAASQIIDVARRMAFRPDELGQRGAAKDGWTVDLRSEYDCQNLFFTVIKPWLPLLAREEVTIRFDDQDKLADFSLFENRLIVEMKFIDSLPKKAEVVKTLDGLQRFYSRNGSVALLLFIVYVKDGVPLDAARWEADYSFRANLPAVTTVVIPVP